MNQELTAQLASVADIIIFLALSYFYRTRLKHNLLRGNERLVGIGVIALSVPAGAVPIELDLQPERNWPIINQADLHVSAKHTTNRHVMVPPCMIDQVFKQLLTLLGTCAVGKARA